MVRQRELTRGLAVSDVMGTRPRLETVTPYHTFGQVLDSVIHGYQEDFPVVDEDAKLVGMITRNEIMTAAHSPERYASVRDLMQTGVPTISPEADLFTEGARILQESGLRALPVVRGGDVVGMLTMDDIGQFAWAANQEVSGDGRWSGEPGKARARGDNGTELAVAGGWRGDAFAATLSRRRFRVIRARKENKRKE